MVTTSVATLVEDTKELNCQLQAQTEGLARLARMSPQGLPKLTSILRDGKWEKLSTIGEAMHGKVYHAKGFNPAGEPLSSFVLKVMPRAKVDATWRNHKDGLENPRADLIASLLVRKFAPPKTVQVYFVAQDDLNYYIGSEYCPGGELLSLMNRLLKRVPPPKDTPLLAEAMLREVATQLLQAVEALHNVGLAHRDITLENVMLTARGEIRLIDFGQMLAVHQPGAEPGTQRELDVPAAPFNLMPGKPNYRPIELSSGSPYSAKKVDIYQVGIILYTMAVGRYPTDEIRMAPTTEDDAGRCTALRSSLARQGLSDRLAPGLQDLLEKLLAPRASMRPSASEALAHYWITGMEDVTEAETDVGEDTATASECSG